MTPTTRRYVLALFLLLQALDVLTTAAGLRNGAVEANPFAAWVMGTGGEFVMYGLKAAVALGERWRAMRRVCAVATRLRHAVIGTQEAIDLRTEWMAAVDALAALPRGASRDVPEAGE